MLLLLLFHAVVGTGVLAAGGRVGRRWGVGLGVLPVAATLLWLLIRLPDVVDGRVLTERVAWISDLSLAVELRLDGYAALMVLLVSGIGVLVFAYAASYLSDDSPNVGRLIGLLTLFSGAMAGLVLADNLFVLYLFWELTSITSYLLIGNDHENRRARAAALQALFVTSAGALTMFVGFILIGQAAGTYRLSEIVDSPPEGRSVTVGLVLVLVGAASKSAQYPFHAWLPGAMVAPSPVSAYLHSATMVKAGVYLVARFAPAFATVGPWRPIVITVGLVSMVCGGLRALRQHDLKLLLAFGTVSQLGLLFVLFGVGVEAAAAAGCVMLLAHAMFKAALFMVVGMIDHQTGTRDLRALRELGVGWTPVVAIGVVGAASMAGVPLMFGFVSKDAAFDAFANGGLTGAYVVLAVVVAASCLTAAYSIRCVWGAFTAGGTDWAGAPPPVSTAVAPTRGFWLPPALLAVATVVLGVAPFLADGVIDAAASALEPDSDPVHLAVWHGFNLAFALSAVVIVCGLAMFAARRPIAGVLALGRRLPSGADVYFATLRGLNAFADRLTGGLQNGSLPFYLAVILVTATLAPGIVLVSSTSWPGWPELLDTPAHLPIAAALVGGAIGAAIVRRRLGAVVLLGFVGYGMAGLFVVEGAPDLALTQVTVETLSTVVFVLVLRRLPPRFSERTPAGRVVRLAVSALVGVVVFGFALTAAGNRSARPVSDEMIARSLPDGGGKNVVNVILVDFRGLDTLGEITVLGVAAVGAVALARATLGRRPITSAVSVGTGVGETSASTPATTPAERT